MKEVVVRFSVFVMIILFSTIAFGQDYQKTPSGLKYKFFNRNEKGEKAKIGDMVTVVGYYKVKDTIFFDSRKSPTPYIFPINESSYPGDIFEGMRMMAVGDSAVFVVSGDSLFLKTFKVKNMPKYITPGSEVSFFVKVLKKQPKEEFQKEMQAKFEAESKKSAQLAAQEDSIIKDYMNRNKLKGEASKSGLYYVETLKGNGVKAVPGAKVTMQYTGKLLDGTVFDSSIGRSEPFSFPLGQNKVIKGWEEGITKMNKGGKAIFLIPSKLAYGSSSVGKIPANSILIFEVELVDVQLPPSDEVVLSDYIKKNNIKAEATGTGLFYSEVKKGTGPKATPGKTVTVQYTGKLLDGTVFDSSVGRPEPFTFQLGQNKVIKGWEEGIARMNKGGKAILLIPSKLAYGANAMGKIPANSPLIFEVELVDVK